MSRTRRIYNNPHIKKTIRNDISQPGQKLFRDMTEGELASYINDPLRNAVQFKGFLYHPYASGLCMGHCPHCRDPSQDQRHLRKIRKREFRNELEDELSEDPIEEPEIEDL